MSDAFTRLWTPHRMAYIRGQDKPSDDTEGACPFCRMPQRSADDQGLVVRHGDGVYAVLNLYPYAPGHLMVVPRRHVADYTEVTDDERTAMADLTREAIRALEVALGATGFNLGMNQGAIAGAGISAHLHQHVVPRWEHDPGAVPPATPTEPLAATRDRVAAAWRTLCVDPRTIEPRAWGDAEVHPFGTDDVPGAEDGVVWVPYGGGWWQGRSVRPDDTASGGSLDRLLPREIDEAGELLLLERLAVLRTGEVLRRWPSSGVVPALTGAGPPEGYAALPAGQRWPGPGPVSEDPDAAIAAGLALSEDVGLVLVGRVVARLGGARTR